MLRSKHLRGLLRWLGPERGKPVTDCKSREPLRGELSCEQGGARARGGRVVVKPPLAIGPAARLDYVPPLVDRPAPLQLPCFRPGDQAGRRSGARIADKVHEKAAMRWLERYLAEGSPR